MTASNRGNAEDDQNPEHRLVKASDGILDSNAPQVLQSAFVSRCWVPKLANHPFLRGCQ